MIDLPLSRSGQDAMQVTVRAAREAGLVLKDNFYREKHVESKGSRNLITETDQLSEKRIKEIISDEYPGHSILGEESGETENKSDYRWIVDPLDGTNNYAFGIPVFCVSIAVVHNDEPVLGIIYDPMRDELFQTKKGGGAFLNDSPMSVVRDRGIGTRFIGFDLGYDDTGSREVLSFANNLWSPNTAFRLLGSAALGITYVACGRLDIYFHRWLYPWDMAAAALLLTESGGACIDWNGEPATVWSKGVIACADLIKHRDVINALTGGA